MQVRRRIAPDEERRVEQRRSLEMDFRSAVRPRYVEAPGSTIELGPADDRLENEVHGFGCTGRGVCHAGDHADEALAGQRAQRPDPKCRR